MSTLNQPARELSIKIVYYGPGLGGKTASLQCIHRGLRPETRGQLVSLATGADRTLYFDFLPVEVLLSGGFTVRMHLYTVPGQVHYDATRKLVLNGADGVVFVADSQREREAATIESFENLEDNLREQGRSLDKVPLVFQYNKRDCPDVLPVEELERRLNPGRRPSFETVAIEGVGVQKALKAITMEVLRDLRRQKVVAPTDQPVAAGAIREEWEPARTRPGTGIARDAVPEMNTAGVSEKILELSRREDSGSHPDLAALASLTPLAPGTGVLCSLVPAGALRQQVVQLEAEIARGEYQGAVRRAGEVLAAVTLEVRALDPNAGPAAAALFRRVQPERYARMRELLRRVAGGAVSSEDAAFALFFCLDLLVTSSSADG
jgi:signal recognition particle receptor subunit beta